MKAWDSGGSGGDYLVGTASMPQCCSVRTCPGCLYLQVRGLRLVRLTLALRELPGPVQKYSHYGVLCVMNTRGVKRDGEGWVTRPTPSE